MARDTSKSPSEDPKSAADHPDWDVKRGTPKDNLAKAVVEQAHERYSGSAQSEGPAQGATAIRSAGAHGPAQAPGFPAEPAAPGPTGAAAKPGSRPAPSLGSASPAPVYDEPMTTEQAARLTALCERVKVENSNAAD